MYAAIFRACTGRPDDDCHTLAQQRMRDGWYRGYKLQVLEMRREYSFDSDAPN